MKWPYLYRQFSCLTHLLFFIVWLLPFRTHFSKFRMPFRFQPFWGFFHLAYPSVLRCYPPWHSDIILSFLLTSNRIIDAAAITILTFISTCVQFQSIFLIFGHLSAIFSIFSTSTHSFFPNEWVSIQFGQVSLTIFHTPFFLRCYHWNSRDWSLEDGKFSTIHSFYEFFRYSFHRCPFFICDW